MPPSVASSRAKGHLRKQPQVNSVLGILPQVWELYMADIAWRPPALGIGVDATLS